MVAAEIFEYPGAAGPVSGWCVPTVTVVAVTPGTLSAEPPDLLLVQPAAATTSARPASAATARRPGRAAGPFGWGRFDRVRLDGVWITGTPTFPVGG